MENKESSLIEQTHNHRLIMKDAYLYSISSGRFIVREASIFQSCYNSRKVFYITPLKTFGCSREEGVVYNSTVWLSENKPKLAANILITHHELLMDSLREQMDNHQHKIDVLKGEMEK